MSQLTQHYSFITFLEAQKYQYVGLLRPLYHIYVSQKEEDTYKTPLNPNKSVTSSAPIPSASPRATPRRDINITSARSLAGTGTLPFRMYMKGTRSGPSTQLAVDSDLSFEGGPCYIQGIQGWLWGIHSYIT